MWRRMTTQAESMQAQESRYLHGKPKDVNGIKKKVIALPHCDLVSVGSLWKRMATYDWNGEFLCFSAAFGTHIHRRLHFSSR